MDSCKQRWSPWPGRSRGTDTHSPHRTRISSTNPFGIFPHAAACLRLIGMVLVEKNEDWLTDDKAYLTVRRCAGRRIGNQGRYPWRRAK